MLRRICNTIGSDLASVIFPPSWYLDIRFTKNKKIFIKIYERKEIAESRYRLKKKMDFEAGTNNNCRQWDKINTETQ